MSTASLRSTGCKKELFKYRPRTKTDPPTIETHRTKQQVRAEPTDPNSIERGVRQLLANKVSGNLIGLWLLIPEHLRLGTWDLLARWRTHASNDIESRLALQLIHESALCVPGMRQNRTLSQKGFELAHGLPFVATDEAIRRILDAHSVRDAADPQLRMGLLRKARSHFNGRLLAIDPHRPQSYSKRQMPRRQRNPK